MTRILFVMLALSAAAPAAAIKICIDPGHGGQDPGGVGCGLEESEIVLDVSNRLETLLEGAGFEVVMTRSTDVFIELTQRTDFANAQGADRFASIHANAFSNSSANGTETFCHTSLGAQSVDMRDRIQTEMIDAWGLTDRGGKTANFHVLSATNMPATLSELAFVTNCSVDATFLADSTRRQQAAQAHLEAIAAHLGVDPGNPVDPPPETGTMNGVVFEDQGVGTANMDTRLPGAAVTVVDSGDSVSAGADGAAWTFDLAPGSYTFRASLAGYVTAERDCTVVAGDIAWCSIGLFPASAGEGEGEGEGEPVGEGEGEGDGPISEGEGEGEGDGIVPPGDDIDRITILPPPPGGCASTSTAPFALFALALLALRKRRALPLLALCIALPAQAAPRELGVVDGGVSVSDAHLVAPGLFTAALLSPDGSRVLVSDDRYVGLSVVDLVAGTTTTLTEGRRAGFRAVWVDDTHVAYRNPARPFDGDPLVALNMRGELSGPHFEHKSVSARQGSVRDVVEVNGAAVSAADDRCFAPVVSTGGDVVYQCLRTGLYLYRPSTKATFALGAGTAPSFSKDGALLVFARTRDEGHETVESDVVVVELTSTPRARRWVTPELERSPSLSADGSLIGFVTDDGAFVARLSLGK